jgi:hypothetical protein
MGSISGTFVLASFVGGLFCRHLLSACLVGLVFALSYVTLVVIGLWDTLGDANLPYLAGSLTGAGLVIFIPAILASDLRRGAGRLLRRGKTRKPVMN